MSGLDPVGRRAVRELILELRDEGRTILFSSHILADAEALCTAVGILNRGRLVASGPLHELTNDQARGWEIVAALPPAAAERLAPQAARWRLVTPGRYRFDLEGTPPEPFVAAVASAGGALVSVEPVRTTLEDVFVRAVAATPGQQADA
jgi:ABC-2 type transport system ATP-binding protein